MYKTIDDYIGSFPDQTKVILQKIRETIRKVLPDGEETISYQIPCFKLNGKYVIYFAGFAHHVSIYPAPRGAAEFREELADYKGGKGTVQFPLDKPLPLALIAKIVRFRVKERTKKNSL
jgi:uncharacterized protein YdhG (YjbR/CyaY superfamily)